MSDPNNFLGSIRWPRQMDLTPPQLPRMAPSQRPTLPNSHIADSLPWHGGGDHARPRENAFANAFEPAAVYPGGTDQHSLMRRLGSDAWNTIVQPNLNTGAPSGARSQIGIDWNPIEERRPSGVNARWNWQW